MAVLTCPSREQLLAFNSGKLSAVALDQIGEHVLYCQVCQKIMASAAPADALLAALRHSKQRDPFAMEVECEQAIAQIQTLQPASELTVPSLERVGPYKIVSQLGQGGMGSVYKALHPFLKRMVALKVLAAERVLDREAVVRFGREMEAIGKLHHSNIVQAIDAGESDGQRFLVMEYVEGCDLASLVREQGPLPVADACEAIRQAALGLQHAHEHGLVHRDIKPSNLMLTPQGQVKVLDLGLALLHGEISEKGLTTAGQIMGTFDYMAPEQAFDPHGVDGRADVYSLGCTLFFLLTGQSPYTGSEYRQPLKKMLAHASQPVPSLQRLRPDAPQELESLLQRLLAKKPTDRFATPQDVATALTPFCTRHHLAGVHQLHSPLVDTVSEVSNTRVEAESRPASMKGRIGTQVPSVARRVRPLLQCGGVFAVTTLALAGVLAAPWLAGVIFRVETPGGTLVIDVDQPDVEVFINGKQATLKVPGAGEPITLEVDEGKHELKVSKGGFETYVKQFGVKAGRKEAVKVHLEPLAVVATTNPPATADAARSAIEWVLKTGGTVELNEGRMLKSVADLSPGPLQPVGVFLAHKSTLNGSVDAVLTDADLEHLSGLPDSVRKLDLRNHAYSDAGINRLTSFHFAATLRLLRLVSPKLTDTGLVAIQRCRDLVELSWSSPNCSGSGLESLRNLSGLRDLYLSYCPLTDAGIAQLAGMQLRLLEVRGARIGDEGMKSIGTLTNLETLGLNGVEGISDVGLVHLQDLKKLRLLDLNTCALVTDEGLKPLEQLHLTTLYLQRTQVTDKGIKSLSDMKELKILSLVDAKVTAAGLEKLHKALPDCNIEGNPAEDAETDAKP